MYSIHKNPIGIYEKALPNSFTWEGKVQGGEKAGFDYMEISIDEQMSGWQGWTGRMKKLKI